MDALSLRGFNCLKGFGRMGDLHLSVVPALKGKYPQLTKADAKYELAKLILSEIPILPNS